MRWKWFLIFPILVLFPYLVLAESQINLKPLKNTIVPQETALFQLSITNEAKEKQRYSLFSFVQGWDIEPSPLKDKIIEIPPGETKNTTIKVKPKELFNPGLYSLILNIETDLGEKYTQNLEVYIKPEEPLGYLPSFQVTLDLNKKINPQEFQTIKLFLKNKNPLNLSKLTLKLQSDLPEFNKELIFSLAPLEKKTIEFAITPNPFQKPGEYFLFFTFEREGEIIKIISQPIEILALALDFQTNLTKESFFLKTKGKLFVQNKGNVKDTQKITLPLSFWESLFTQSTGEIIEKEGQKYLSWEVTLSPQETIVLTFTQNYRYPFYFLLVVVFLFLVYFQFRSPLTISKTATSMKKDATLSELKTILQLRNLSKRSFRNLEIIDLFPESLI